MAGGARKGAGRKAGSKDSKPRVTAARKIAAAAADEGITPAEIMLRTARHLWAEATDECGRVTNLERALAASAVAEKAAPYFNPKLASVEHTGKDGGPIQTEAAATIDVTGLNADQLRALASIKVPAG